MKVYFPAEPFGTRLFTRESSTPHHIFSDGKEVESRLRQTIEAADDRSQKSEALRNGIVDWPSFYHLTAERANLLRPFAGWLKDARVLEIGCGCGAITRFLGETGAQVTAVEPALARAELAALRCADLENVSVFVDDLEHFETPATFPFITAIGVLEYAPLYSTGPDPLSASLRRLATLLDDDGVLFIAIENQLGLRYFNGFPEEHVDLPFCGVHGIYPHGGPATLGRAHWTECLESAGFQQIDFYCPFPDYKTPRAIICPDAFHRSDLDISHILAGASAIRWRSNENMAFSEAAAWRPIVRNGLTQDLSNSFLILAGRQRQKRHLEGFAYVFSDVRLPAFSKEVVFQDRDGILTAIPRKMYPEVDDVNGTYSQVLREEPVIGGEHYDTSLDAIVLRPGWSTAEVGVWAGPWFDFLTAGAISPGVLPEDWVDCVPANLIRKTDGSLEPFDLEYRVGGGPALDFVLFRGLWNSLAARGRCAAPEAGDRTISEHVAEIIQILMPFSPCRLDELIRMEVELQRQVTGVSIDEIERRLRTARPSPLPVFGYDHAAALPHFQLFWRERGFSDYTEENSTSVPLDLSNGTSHKLRASIPANLDLNAFRFDLLNRPAVLAGLQIQLLDADQNHISTVTADCRNRPAKDLSFLVLPESAAQLGEVAVLLSADPQFEYELSAVEIARLKGGGVAAIAFEYNESEDTFRSINGILAAENAELGRLRSESWDLAARNMELGERVSAQAEQAAAAKTTITQLTGEKQRLSDIVTANEANIDRYQGSIRELAGEQQRLWDILKANQEVIRQYQRTMREQAAEQQRLWHVLKTHEATIARCQRSLDEREARLEAVLNSYTWKISMATGGRLVRAVRSLSNLVRPRK